MSENETTGISQRMEQLDLILFSTTESLVECRRLFALYADRAQFVVDNCSMTALKRFADTSTGDTYRSGREAFGDRIRPDLFTFPGDPDLGLYADEYGFERGHFTRISKKLRQQAFDLRPTAEFNLSFISIPSRDRIKSAIISEGAASARLLEQRFLKRITACRKLLRSLHEIDKGFQHK